jgi:hypothetical protein
MTVTMTMVTAGVPHCTAIGNGVLQARTFNPLVCQCTANPIVISSQWTFKDQTLDPTLVTFMSTAEGWYQTSYTPSKPWDITAIGAYTCSVTNALGSGSGAIAGTVDCECGSVCFYNTRYSCCHEYRIFIVTEFLPSMDTLINSFFYSNLTRRL